MPQETPIGRAREIGIFTEELLKTLSCYATVSRWVPFRSARQEWRQYDVALRREINTTHAESLPGFLELSVRNSNEQAVRERKVLRGGADKSLARPRRKQAVLLGKKGNKI